MHDLLRGYAAEVAARDPASERRAALARLRSERWPAAAGTGTATSRPAPTTVWRAR